ncbi:DUF2490 domain-containing protein [Methylovorus mays]|uniref:DUF2490 domain-containing protein n=1 Tax=Methylovorus mays TaxID=184077 RepID=UPI001E4F03F2|nr:DUF2490 domain-containing protein [Methylovorus mays]MCB5208191.1 DUF2490 domain-containing protein [Methylovorus mays]
MMMPRIFLRYLFVIGSLGFTSLAAAATDEDNRLWLNLTMQGSLPADGWRWYAEIQPRLRENAEQMDSLLLRPAINYKVSKNLSVWLGYGYVRNYLDSGDIRDEHRLWQQLLYAFEPVGSTAVSARTRLEERRVEQFEDTGYRLRQMVRITHPLGGKWGAVAWDEVFINTNHTDWGARSGFDQNRLFLGISHEFSASVKTEWGYLNQYIRTAADDRMNHVLSGVLSIYF